MNLLLLIYILLNFFQIEIKNGELIIRGDDYETSFDKHFHLRYGNNLLPLSPCITIPKVKNKITT